MIPLLGDTAPVADLLDVFSSYDGSVVFRDLTESLDGQTSVFGRIGWIFTGFGALFVLWGFMLRTQRSAGEGKTEDIAKTCAVIALMLAGPLLMRAAMEAADGVYASSAGGPRNLTAVCVKAAYAMPELSQLFDSLRKAALGPQPPANSGSQQRQALLTGANDGSVLGYLEAFGVAIWDTAADYSADAARGWNGMVQLATFATGFGSAMLKCLLICLSIVPLYLLLLGAAAIVWFMEQLRYFLAVSGTMMLPLFIGMFSLPAGHFNRQAAQSYLMHMVSLALWPVAWAIGHTGTIALYNALIALIAGTSRVPDMIGILQWSSLSSGGPSETQVQVMEAALGNWFMGNLAGLLSILVGGLGFVSWVIVVSILGPVFLHKLLTTGALFMTQATGAAAAQGAGAARFAYTLAQRSGLSLGGSMFSGELKAGRRLAETPPSESVQQVGSFYGGDAPRTPAPSSMAEAARQVDNSDGKTGTGV